MFDKKIYADVDARTVFPENFEVNINRAPTDESVRLLREMENEIRKSLFAKLSLDCQNKLLNENAYIQFVYDTQLYCVIVVFSLNGASYSVSFDVDCNAYDVRNKSGFDEFCSSLHRKIVDCLAVKLSKILVDNL